MIRVTAIAENTCYRHNLLALHGQSLLIETNDKKILFDVGEVYVGLRHNLKQSGISIDEITDIVISHRHIDHVLALPELLPELTNQRIYLPTQMGEPHMKDKSEKYRFLEEPDGNQYNLALSKELSEQLLSYKNSQLVTEGFELYDGIYTTGSVGDWMEEQAIVIDQGEKGINVLVGCSHPTLKVLIKKAQEVTGNHKVRGIMGGFHFPDMSESEIIEETKWMHELNLDYLAPGHCTTVTGCMILKKELGEIVHISKTKTFGTGNSIELDPELKFNFIM